MRSIGELFRPSGEGPTAQVKQRWRKTKAMLSWCKSLIWEQLPWLVLASLATAGVLLVAIGNSRWGALGANLAGGSIIGAVLVFVEQRHLERGRQTARIDQRPTTPKVDPDAESAPVTAGVPEVQPRKASQRMEYLQYVNAFPSGPSLLSHSAQDLPTFWLRYAQLLRRAAVAMYRARQIPQADRTIGLTVGGDRGVAEAAALARRDLDDPAAPAPIANGDEVEPLDGDDDIHGIYVELVDVGRSTAHIDAWEVGLRVYGPEPSPGT